MKHTGVTTVLNTWFDDISMTHTKGNVIQYNEYYPFGMQTANSWTRENVTGNKYLYNGGAELNATSGWYETFFRGYDASLGRFLQVDPMADKYAGWTPYNYAFNDPALMNDPFGDAAADPSHGFNWWRYQPNSDGEKVYQDASAGMYRAGWNMATYGHPGNPGNAGSSFTRMGVGNSSFYNYVNAVQGQHNVEAYMSTLLGQEIKAGYTYISDGSGGYGIMPDYETGEEFRGNVYLYSAQTDKFVIAATSRKRQPSGGTAIGISGNITPGGGFNFSLGVVMDHDGDYKWFFSFGPSVGFDGSIGFFSKGIYARDSEWGFSVARDDYAGYGSSFNGGVGFVDVSYGGANNEQRLASHFGKGAYYEVGAGASLRGHMAVFPYMDLGWWKCE